MTLIKIIKTKKVWYTTYLIKMDRRSFIKGLIALASAPAIGKYVNIFKTEGAREGIEQVASQGVDFFNMVIKKVMDEGTLIKEEDRISTFKHPDRPDIVVDVDQTTGSSSVFFEADSGTKSMAEITKTADETTKGRTVEELFEQEEIYGPMGKEPQEGITGGITNLEKFLKSKRGFAAGGRVGMFRGGVPKGLEAALRAIMRKFGDDAITTADKAPQPGKTTQEEIMDFNARNPNPNRQMTDEEITEFADEFGLDPSEEYYNWDGTLADARRLLKESEDETKYMYQQYKAGRLDPKSGEKGRKEFLQKKLDEAELSGESKLITRDEIDELDELNKTDPFSKNFDFEGEVALQTELAQLKEMGAGKLAERFELKQKYPGITDDLLDKILIDDNPQRKAELLATLDEVFTMMRKGKGPDEILSMFKNINRTKQADGGSIDGDVSLTVIKIPDISESGVESLFKRR